MWVTWNGRVAVECRFGVYRYICNLMLFLEGRRYLAGIEVAEPTDKLGALCTINTPSRSPPNLALFRMTAIWCLDPETDCRTPRKPVIAEGEPLVFRRAYGAGAFMNVPVHCRR